MKENTNKAIALNSVIIYIKLFLSTVFGLLTTRFALKALGVDDFGLFSVVGSVISFITILNTMMVATSNRFISVAIGRGNMSEVNEQFNICLVIHIGIAAITILLAIPLGDLYLYHYLNYSGSLKDAISVYHYSVIGSAISFIAVPYNGLLMAKERFWVFSIVDVLLHALKMGVAYLLIFYFSNKLIIYGISQGFLTAIVALIYLICCKQMFPDLVRWKMCWDKLKYKEVLSFSGWIGFGAIATVGKSQGAALLVNLFFNTIMNAALGLANTVNNLIITFSNAIGQPIAPQITKSYASGMMARCEELLIMSTKYTFIVTFVISAPFICDSGFIYLLWLGQVPEYVEVFTMLLIIDSLVSSLNSGISNVIFSSGRIRLYQLSINTLRLFSIVCAYFVLKMGAPAPALLYAYILFSFFILIASQLSLKKTINFNTRVLWAGSYFPSLKIVVLFVLINHFIGIVLNNAFMHIALMEVVLIAIVFIVGLNKSERQAVLGYLKRK